MSRLTRRIIDICGSCDQQEYCRYTPNAGNCYLRQLHEKLKHYEDLEEQGRLIELPCKVGDEEAEAKLAEINNRDAINTEVNYSDAMNVYRELNTHDREKSVSELAELKGTEE